MNFTFIGNYNTIFYNQRRTPAATVRSPFALDTLKWSNADMSFSDSVPIVAPIVVPSLFLLVVLAIAWLVARRRERREIEAAPTSLRRPFEWGYTNGYFVRGLALSGSALIFAAMIGVGNPSKSEWFDLLCFTLAASILGWGLLARNRWAWLIHVAFISVGPGWIINGIYLTKRWSEMQDEWKEKRFSSRWQDIPILSRALLAGTIFWWISLIAWINLFDPYAMFENFSTSLAAEDLTYIIKLFIFPPVLAAIGTILWTKVVTGQASNSPPSQPAADPRV